MADILLVDDVPAVRLSLRLALERAGHAVVEAADGAAALRHLDGRRFDLVITDLWMPGLDGVRLIARLRALDARVPILVVTGGAPDAPQGSAVPEALALGADGVLYKPVARSELLAGVTRLLPAGT